jgi:hypothetical protein
MKISLCLLGLLSVVACTKPHPRATTEFPTLLTGDREWVAYEGILPSKDGDTVFTELSLQTSAPGIDSRYRMNQSVTHPDYSMGSSSYGAYRVLSGAADNYIIQLLDKRPLTKFWKGTRVIEAEGPPVDMFFQNRGAHRLLLVDEAFQTYGDREYILHRRSDLFTVEGYFTVYPDTVEFFEKNTRKRWAVARFGYYHDAVKTYHLFAKQKHEGIYLKALSYSTPERDSSGNEIDALVFKRILQMDSLQFFQ